MGQREDQFEDIAQQAIMAAEKVDCRLEEFRDGLVIMLDEIRERLSLANDELGEIAHQVEHGDEYGGES